MSIFQAKRDTKNAIKGPSYSWKVWHVYNDYNAAIIGTGERGLWLRSLVVEASKVQFGNKILKYF